MSRKIDTRKRIRAHIRSKGGHGDFEVTPSFALYWWHRLNEAVFDSILSPPVRFEVKKYFRDDSAGWCMPYARTRKQRRVIIGLTEEYFDRKQFLTVLAHEMVHQWEWEINADWNSKVAHGKTFWSWASSIKARVGLPLSEDV